MTMPVFEEFEPARDCACRGCAQQRRDLARAVSARDGGHPAAHGARRAMVFVTAAGAVLGGSNDLAAALALERATPVPVAEPGPEAQPSTPQGKKGPLHGPAGTPAPPPDTEPPPQIGASPEAVPAIKAIDRATIINRAKLWLNAKVPYSMTSYWPDGYRQDCSGYVSMAWNLGSNEWTGSLDRFATRITKEQLQPGDMLLFHNPADPNKGSHVTLFGGWTDHTRTYYVAYEQTKPHTRKLATPYGYWTNATKYLPYRFNGVVAGTTGEQPSATPAQPPTGGSGGQGPASGAAFPGAGYFGPGANNQYVTQLRQMLLARGGGRFYQSDPGPEWSEADRLATQAFQRAQGWTGTDADGLPGPETWRLLVERQGKDIPPSATTSVRGGAATPIPAFPGRGVFRRGTSHPAIQVLARQLVKKGFGKHYPSTPGPYWDETDRRNVEAFQRAQGWRGAAADGYPGPETWRRLFA
ncbi:peptidoglycan-binding protein [Streptomyces sp. NPDC006879]|uniref:peptidoglycan-binding protein n=1 Tax=Streptomyces sp. NPDC006879 TaxID=3364767 RepID=UPI00368106F4